MVITARTRNAVVSKEARGFESHLLRQRPRAADKSRFRLCLRRDFFVRVFKMYVHGLIRNLIRLANFYTIRDLTGAGITPGLRKRALSPDKSERPVRREINLSWIVL